MVGLEYCDNQKVKGMSISEAFPKLDSFLNE